MKYFDAFLLKKKYVTENAFESRKNQFEGTKTEIIEVIQEKYRITT